MTYDAIAARIASEMDCQVERHPLSATKDMPARELVSFIHDEEVVFRMSVYEPEMQRWPSYLLVDALLRAVNKEKTA